MAATIETNRVFLPYLRRGLATAITQPDGPAEAPTGPVAGGPTVPFTAAVTVVDKAVAGTPPTLGVVNVSLPLVGPGDIAGLDPRVVVRTTPLANESDAEFKHFVAIEFDQADLPWRYTPAAALSNGQLHPWFTLLVGTAAEISVAPATPAQKLPVATVQGKVQGGPPGALPDLSQGWAWAHVQLHGQAETAANDPTQTGPLANFLAQQPGLFVARLMSSRVLQAQTAYTAILVPTFERGRLAGLGQDPGQDPTTGTDALKWAWTADAVQATLPVYYQWQFQTGVVGKFEDLVAELAPQPLPATVGRRNMDVSVPGFTLGNAATPGTSMPMEGALQSVAAEELGEPPPVSSQWLNGDATHPGFEAFINTSSISLSTGTKPLVGPPLYGRWYSGETQLNPSTRAWVAQLNSDPRNRASASLGTLVVDERQQALLASAWSQIEGLLQANGELKVLQLGREAFTRTFNRHVQNGVLTNITGILIDDILMVLGILHRWVLRSQKDFTIHFDTGQSTVGRAIFEPQWRRLTRPRGPIGRRQIRHLGKPMQSPGPVTALGGGFQPAPPPGPPDGMATPDQVYQGTVPGNLTTTEITILVSQGNDAMLFWGILLFCVARQFLAGGAEGRAWWWLLRVLRFGLELIRLANGTTTTIIRIAITSGTQGTLTPGQVSSYPPVPSFTASPTIPTSFPVPPQPVVGGKDSTDAGTFRTGLTAIEVYYGTPEVAPVQPTTIDLVGTMTVLLSGLSPAVTLLASINTRLTGGFRTNWNPADQLEPVQAFPVFSQPMWQPLRDESIDWIIPGLQDVATNSVGLMVSNQRFIEAYMVGLNQEMGRTLLWNGFPTDQRGTYFQQFWDSRATPQVANQSSLDIKQIATWQPTASLGSNSARTTPSSAVLLVRADLIRRYPNVVVYAFNNNGGSPNNESSHVNPIFSGQLTADISFYGFPFSVNDALGGQGYSFVLEEHPSEPRFDPPDGAVAGNFVDPASINTSTAAAFAGDRLQQPTRAIIPASLIVPPN